MRNDCIVCAVEVKMAVKYREQKHMCDFHYQRMIKGRIKSANDNRERNYVDHIVYMPKPVYRLRLG